jgi:hypothetical protein
MQAIFGRKSIVRLVLVWTLVALVTACQAQSTVSLDKHARKVHKRLATYPAGTYLTVVLRDGSERIGALGTLAPASFTITDSDSNARETHSYNDVAKVSKGTEYIGEGSGRGHHIRLWVPAVVGAVAAGAAATVLAIR